MTLLVSTKWRVKKPRGRWNVGRMRKSAPISRRFRSRNVSVYARSEKHSHCELASRFSNWKRIRFVRIEVYVHEFEKIVLHPTVFWAVRYGKFAWKSHIRKSEKYLEYIRNSLRNAGHDLKYVHAIWAQLSQRSNNSKHTHLHMEHMWPKSFAKNLFAVNSKHHIQRISFSCLIDCRLAPPKDFPSMGKAGFAYLRFTNEIFKKKIQINPH